MGDGMEEYRKRMEEKFKKDNESKGMFASLYPRKDNKPDSRPTNEQSNNTDADYEYARKNEDHEVYDMRNVNTIQAGENPNKIQRQKTGPRQDPIELSDMSRSNKVDKTNANQDDHRIGFDDYGGSNHNKGSFFDSIKDKMMETWEDMSTQGRCSAVTTCVCCFFILIIVLSSF